MVARIMALLDLSARHAGAAGARRAHCDWRPFSRRGDLSVAVLSRGDRTATARRRQGDRQANTGEYLGGEYRRIPRRRIQANT
jgi:hypothetical protein